MSVIDRSPTRSGGFVPKLPTRVLPPPQVRDLPEPPTQLWRSIGPGMVGAGVGLASGEFILWPYIASQVGLVFLWGALVGVIMQWFLNMEIERYTLATGETALTGFNRFWKHWGLVFAVMAYFAEPVARLGDQLGDDADLPVRRRRTRGSRSACWWSSALTLTLAPVVYVVLERLIFVKVAAVGRCSSSLALVFAITAGSLAARCRDGRHPPGSSRPSSASRWCMGAIAFAGAGGGQNLCRATGSATRASAWARYVPRLVSPITGDEEAAPEPPATCSSRRGEPGALAALVAVRQHRAGARPSC